MTSFTITEKLDDFALWAAYHAIKQDRESTLQQ